MEIERTINRVYDVEREQIYETSDFLKKPEHELMRWRRALEEAIIVGKALLICPYCKQMLKLCGRRDYRGTISYFSHLYDSDDCEIKTTSNISKEEINARRYGAISESKRHQDLKTLIADVLSSSKSRSAGVSSVGIEQRIEGPIPYMNWRRPDVVAQFNGKNIVFELQLSTTFLSVVVDRDLFYRLHGYYIIWVFNFDDNKEYVNLQNMMCKDIYYANKRNIFILDKHAQELSQERGELILHCRWMDENGKFSEGEYITLEQLSFDTETFKPFYIDADKIYYDAHPDIKSNLNDLEKSRTAILQELMNRNKRELELLQEECQRIEAIKKHIISENDKAETYIQDEKLGFIYQNQVLSRPIYTEIEWSEELNMFHIIKARRQGLANRAGEAVLPCKFSKIKRLSNNKFLVVSNREWRIWGSTSILKTESKTDEYTYEEIGYNFSLITFVFKERGVWQEQEKIFLIFPNHNTVEVSKIEKLKQTVIIEGEEYTINPDGKIRRNIVGDIDIVMAGHMLLGLNKGDIEVVSPIYTKLDYISEKCILVYSKEYMGVVSINGQTIIPLQFFHKCIKLLTDDLFLILDNGNWYIWGSSSVHKREDNFVDYTFEKIEHNFSTITFKYHKRYGFGYSNYEYKECKDTFLIFPSHNTVKVSDVDRYKQVVVIEGTEYTINPDGKIYHNVVDGIDLIMTGHNQTGLNKGGLEALPPIYTKLDYISDKCIFVYNDNYMGVLSIDRQTIIPIKFTNIEIEKFGLYKVYRFECGLYDDSGTMIIPTIYKNIQPISSERFIVNKYCDGQSLFGVLDNHNNIIVPIEFDGIDIHDNKITCCKKVGNSFSTTYYHAIYSIDGQELIPLSWNVISVDYRSDNIIALTQNKNNAKYHNSYKLWLKPDNTLLLPLGNDVSEIGEFHNGVADCRITGKYAKIDMDGNIFDIVENHPDTIAMVCHDGCYGLTNVRGQILIPCKYHTLKKVPNGLYIGDEHDLISDEGLLIKSFIGEIFYLNEDILILKNSYRYKNQLNICDKVGNLLIDKDFSAIYESNGYIHTELIYEHTRGWQTHNTTLHGLYDINLEQVIDTVYESIEFIDTHTVVCNSYKGAEITNIKSKKQYKASHINKIAEIEGIEYYCLLTRDNHTLIDGNLKQYGMYTNIVFDKDAQIIKGFKDDNVYNAITAELMNTVELIEVDKIYKGSITNIKDYGIFVKVNGNHDGLIHKSMLKKHHLTLGSFKIGQTVDIKVIEIRTDKKLNLDIIKQ